MRRLFTAISVLPLTLSIGCSGEGTASTSCTADQELFQGRCVNPATRYEPDARVDDDNVVAFGDPFTQITLPDPPKSGFRIIAPPRVMQPGEEVDDCVSWPYPAIKNKIVYAARLYATPGVHHSNLIAKPINESTGPNPYPGCNPGASDPFGSIGAGIPDVLFASSTQVSGQEALTFPVGMGFRVDTSREIATDLHLLNTTTEPQRVELAYDFFTMPESDLENEVAPFTLQVDDFLVPPHSQKVIGSECASFGGQVVEMLPHTHKLRRAFTVDFIKEDETRDNVLSFGAFDSGSEIRVFDDPLSLEGVKKVGFSCTFDNITDHDVVYGLGENEMCILFGYVFPVRSQFVGHAPYQGEACQSIQLGLFR
ncbi:Hypothetical protein A7982_05589 [Minicystis rosea]|nr:Hypothetical protein A7982_05589 [Minicystis rosea]